MSGNNPAPSRSVNENDLLASAIPIDDGRSAEDELEPIELEAGDDPGSPRPGHKIRTFGPQSPASQTNKWTRQPNATGQGAVHVKTFVAKLRLDAIEHLDEQINEWLDAHPEYEAKFVTTTVGALVGKMTEDALFVNIWV